MRTGILPGETQPMNSLAVLAALLSAHLALAQSGFETREVDAGLAYGPPIIREDFERCQPADAIVLDERKPDTWLLRTKDWPTRLLNAMGNPPDLTYDPQLTGVYDIYVGTRATHFPVSMGLRLASETAFTIVTSPRATEAVHTDWEFCLRRAVKLDGEQIIIHATGDSAYLDYFKFVPIIAGKVTVRAATDHVVIAAEPGKHFAFPGVAKLKDGTLAVVFRDGVHHVDPSGKVSLCRSTDGGRTWTPREVIFDDPAVDERDPGILQHSGGTLIVSFHSNGAMTMRSTDGGHTWDAPTPAPVFSPHGPGEMPDGRIYWCGIATERGMNHVKIAVSEDLGKTWQILSTIAESLPFHQPWVSEFWDEPHALPLDAKHWLCHYRVDMNGFLYQGESEDGGLTFTLPHRTDIWGHPFYILKLADGRLLTLYGYRRAPWGIRACISADQGQTWDLANELVLRHDGGHVDLGYPVGIELEPGLVLAVYYTNHGGGDCSIEGTFFRP